MCGSQLNYVHNVYNDVAVRAPMYERRNLILWMGGSHATSTERNWPKTCLDDVYSRLLMVLHVRCHDTYDKTFECKHERESVSGPMESFSHLTPNQTRMPWQYDRFDIKADIRWSLCFWQPRYRIFKQVTFWNALVVTPDSNTQAVACRHAAWQSTKMQLSRGSHQWQQT